jgi:hypothetical protein
MATKHDARSVLKNRLPLLHPPVEVEGDLKDDADAWLADANRPGHFMSMMTAEGEIRTAMYWITEPEVSRAFRQRWCKGAC